MTHRFQMMCAAAAATLVLSLPAFAQGPHVHEHGTAPQAGPAKDGQVVDPVCGMKVDPKTATAKSVYAGKSYYFCSKEDKATFDDDPEKFLKKQ
jgi:YHS domain-containing protein